MFQPFEKSFGERNYMMADVMKAVFQKIKFLDVVGERIYFGTVPDDSDFPYITVKFPLSQPEKRSGGYEIITLNCLINIYSTSFAEATNILLDIPTSFENSKLLLDNGEVIQIVRINENIEEDPELSSENQLVYDASVSMDFTIQKTL